ncbi:hypothetical protein EMCRGX_G025249 [Ephydatia muelleri]
MKDWSRLLSGSNKARVVSSLLRQAVSGSGFSGEGRHAAVLVPLLIANGEPSVLFTIRSTNLSRHRGQVSFPGGISDPHDASLVATALRETSEELGVDPKTVEVWGELPTLPDRQKSSVITPVLGLMTDITSLVPNPAEVAEVFTLPIRHLAHPDNHRYTIFKGHSVRYPVFLGGPRKIWGLSGFILNMTLLQLLPPEFKYQSLT